MTPDERDELLIRLDTRMESVHLAVHGNGDPSKGLVSRMAAQEQALAEIKSQAVSSGAKRGAATGGVVGVLIAILPVVLRALGIPIPAAGE